MKIIFTAWALAFLFFPQQVLFAEDITVKSVGMDTDKKGALLQAQRGAVEKGIGTIIISETEVKNFMVKKDIVLSKTVGAVKKYDILRESETPDGLVEVEIQAVVSSDRITSDLHALGILMESMDKPRIMVLVNEYIDGQRTHTCETKINEALQKKNFNMVDAATTAAILQKNEDLIGRIVAGDKAAIYRVGTDNGAEVMITGNVSASLSGELYGLNSAQADISIQAILCGDGKIIASKNLHGAASHLSPQTAMTNAVKDGAARIFESSRKENVTTSLFDDIIGSWQDMQNNGTSIKVIVKNVTAYSDCKAIKTFMEHSSDNVVKVIQRGWNAPTLELEVVYKGTSESLADKIDGRKLPEQRALSITGLSSGSVSAVLEGGE